MTRRGLPWTVVACLLLLAGRTVDAGSGRPAPGGAGLPWEREFALAQKKARAAHKPVLVDFWAEWCHYCHELDRTTYADARVIELAGDFVPVTVDTEGNAKDRALADRYDVKELPTILVVTPEGRSVVRLDGFQAADPFVATLEKARTTARELMELEARIAADPKDARSLASLGFHVYGQADAVASLDLLSRAVPLDGQSPVAARKRARVMVAVLEARLKQYAKAEAAFSEARALAPAGQLEPQLLLDLEDAFMTGRRTDSARRVADEIAICCADSPIAGQARDLLVTPRESKK
jgi:thiol-disulfide isomerase/thioredoxin